MTKPFGKEQTPGVNCCIQCGEDKGIKTLPGAPEGSDLYCEKHTKEVLEWFTRKLSNNGSSQKTTATTIYPSTTFYSTTKMKSWGFYDRYKKIYVERFGERNYLINDNGRLDITEIQYLPIPNTKDKKKPVLQIGENFYDAPKEIYEHGYYRTPNNEKILKFTQGKYELRELSDILTDINERISAMFETASQSQVQLWSLFILQSHLKPILNNFFFLGLDSTKGGGKTTALEIISLLCRHGFLGGEVSAASVPRLVEELDLALFVDEIDQRIGKNSEADIVNILRKGQRRGNYYVRMAGGGNGKAMKPERFEIAGTHAYSYRTLVEDAFLSRSIKTPTIVCADSQLPVINLYKETILEDLSDELYFWGFSNIHKLAERADIVEDRVREVVEGSSRLEGCSRKKGSHELRSTLYKAITEKFPKQELDLLSKLIGRNVELCFLLLQLSHIAKLDLLNVLGDTMLQKQEDEDVGDDFLLEYVREVLTTIYENSENITLKDGLNTGCRFVAKNLVYQEWVTKLLDSRLVRSSPGYRKFNGLLRDLGFTDGKNITSQKYLNKPPQKCLIFTQDVVTKLGIQELVLTNSQETFEARKERQEEKIFLGGGA